MGRETLVDWNKRIENGDYEVELYLKIDELQLLFDGLKQVKVNPRGAFKKRALLDLFEEIFHHYTG